MTNVGHDGGGEWMPDGLMSGMTVVGMDAR